MRSRVASEFVGVVLLSLLLSTVSGCSGSPGRLQPEAAAVDAVLGAADGDAEMVRSVCVDEQTGDAVYEEMSRLLVGLDSVYVEEQQVVPVGDGLFFVPLDGGRGGKGVTLEIVERRHMWVVVRVASSR